MEKGISNRTEQVRTAILNKLPNIKNYEDVTTQHLAQIKEFEPKLNQILNHYRRMTSLVSLRWSS